MQCWYASREKQIYFLLKPDVYLSVTYLEIFGYSKIQINFRKSLLNIINLENLNLNR